MMTETTVNVPESQHQGGKPNDNGLSWVRINADYFRTTPGYVKIAQLIIAIICMSLATPYGGTHFFLFVVITSFIGTVIWVFIYLLGIREALNFPINWILTELLNTAMCAVFYFIAFIIQLCVWVPFHSHSRGSNIAAGIFGLFNTLAYGFGAYLLYLESKNNRT